MNVVLRTTLPPASLSRTLDRLVRDVDPAVPIVRPREMNAVFAESMQAAYASPSDTRLVQWSNRYPGSPLEWIRAIAADALPVQLPFTWEDKVWFAVGSKEEGEGFVAAMRGHLGKVTSPLSDTLGARLHTPLLR